MLQGAWMGMLRAWKVVSREQRPRRPVPAELLSSLSPGKALKNVGNAATPKHPSLRKLNSSCQISSM